MADTTQKITVVVGGDVNQLKQELRSINPEFNRMLSSIQQPAQRGGAAAGEAFGKGLHDNTNKWLGLTRNILHRYFGEFGGYIAGFVETLHKAERAAIGGG